MAAGEKDWTHTEAERLAVIARRHGLRCRIVPSAYRDTYLAIYRDEERETFLPKFNAALADAAVEGIDASHSVHKGKVAG